MTKPLPGNLSPKRIKYHAPKGEATNPNKVKPQQCPSSHDTRFSPAKDYEGSFMAEWRQLRGKK